MSDSSYPEKSTLFTIFGIIGLFSTAIIVILLAPRHFDSSWTTPYSSYQKQIYEIADPNFYISSQTLENRELQFVYHLKKDFSLVAFQESETIKFKAPPELEKYITRQGEKVVKLTPRLLLLRPIKEPEIGQIAMITGAQHLAQATEKDATKAEAIKQEMAEVKKKKATIQILELFDPGTEEAFAVAQVDGIIESYVSQPFEIIDPAENAPEYHSDSGVIYVSNPQEYRVRYFKEGESFTWRFDPNGETIPSLEVLKSSGLGFQSRQELIKEGEKVYAQEGCWYCHTDQTRTLIQDVTLNGSDSFPAPPSTANEYIYQDITFPGTRRIGPDISRVGVKRPSRDWHKSHFWAPKNASKGSIMPSFQFFFDDDPRGTHGLGMGIPNRKFEAIYQYLMTKGTRITPPDEAWWNGKDPVNTIILIESRKKP